MSSISPGPPMRHMFEAKVLESEWYDFRIEFIDRFAVRHLIAIGLSGEPQPPVMGRGGAQKKNS